VSNPCQRTNAASAATSPSTIYRRIDRLTEAGLLDERAERDPAGHHRRVNECRLEAVSVAFDDAELRLELVRSRSSDSASWRATGTPRARSASAAAIPVGPAPATRTRASPWPTFEPIPTATDDRCRPSCDSLEYSQPAASLREAWGGEGNPRRDVNRFSAITHPARTYRSG
jgi:hypothetical protein